MALKYSFGVIFYAFLGHQHPTSSNNLFEYFINGRENFVISTDLDRMQFNNYYESRITNDHNVYNIIYNMFTYYIYINRCQIL